MNINEIPLPLTPPLTDATYDTPEIIDLKTKNVAYNRILPSKRHVNNKLPVGVIKKSDSIKLNEGIICRKELFLPPNTQNIQITVPKLPLVSNKKVGLFISPPKVIPLEVKIEANNNKNNVMKSKHDDGKFKVTPLEVKTEVNKNNMVKEKHDDRKNKVIPSEVKIEINNNKNNIVKAKNDDGKCRMIPQELKVEVNNDKNKMVIAKHDDGKCKLASLAVKIEANNNKSNVTKTKYNEGKLDNRKRKSSREHRDYKRKKLEKIDHDVTVSKSRQSHVNWYPSPVFVKSQVIVKERYEKETRPHYRESHRERYEDQYRRSPRSIKKWKNLTNADYDRRYRVPNRRFSPPRHNKRTSHTTKRHKTPDRHMRKKSREPSVISPLQDFLPPTKKPFLTPSVSVSSPSSSLSSNCQVDLPLVSPKSPDEENQDGDVASATVLATNCLKQLSDTLHKMNMAYKNAYSRIPDKTNNVENSINLLNIPLPPEKSKKPNPHQDPPSNVFIGPKTPQLSDNHNENDKDELVNLDGSDSNSSREEIHGNGNKHRTNSINVDNLSLISNSSYESKTFKSPYHSINVSTHSKDSEHSEFRLRPLVPKISSYTIDYSAIDAQLMAELFVSNQTRFLIPEIRCQCAMPTPDDWLSGIRSCSKGQDCLLARLKIECDNHLCPTESLCCNTQFSELKTKLHNIEFFFDSHQKVPWKIRAKKIIAKDTLLFEVAGSAVGTDSTVTTSRDTVHLLITKHIKMSTKSDTHSYMYYLSRGTKDQANVTIEKWIVRGQIRLGVFTTKELVVGEELIVFYPSDHTSVYLEPPQYICDTDSVAACIRYMLHERVSRTSLAIILEKLLATVNTDVLVLPYFLNLGGATVLCRLCDTFFAKDDFSTDLFDKFLDVMLSLPYQHRQHVDKFGIDLQRSVLDLTDKLTTLLPDSAVLIDKCLILNKLLSQTGDLSSLNLTANNPKVPHKVNSSCNSDMLHCRLPPYWCSKECVYQNSHRVFFYHRVTKSMQWDMPVYPWEANDDNDIEIYDYNLASEIQVSHDEIQQMYINLNKIYEMKQKKILANTTHQKRKKDNQDFQKKEHFKKKIMAFINSLLKPYRQPACKEGKIESEHDLHYLTNKLSQTILYKELKILQDKTEFLEVTPQVEIKTKTYVKTYMQSRGVIYKRPIHCPASEHRNGPAQEKHLNS